MHLIVREIIGDRVQSHVADTLKVSRSTVHGWLSMPKGKSRSFRPTAHHLKSLLKCCDASPELQRRAWDAFLEGEGFRPALSTKAGVEYHNKPSQTVEDLLANLENFATEVQIQAIPSLLARLGQTPDGWRFVDDHIKSRKPMALPWERTRDGGWWRPNVDRDEYVGRLEVLPDGRVEGTSSGRQIDQWKPRSVIVANDATAAGLIDDMLAYDGWHVLGTWKTRSRGEPAEDAPPWRAE